MSGTLTFLVDDTLKAIIEHSRAATDRNPSYEQMLDPDLMKPGCEVGLADSVDRSKIPAALMFVKDTGIYLMSNGMPALKKEGENSSLVSYALEADPIKDPDGYYGEARRIAGGDDFVETLDLEIFEEALANDAGAIIIEMSESSMSIGIIPRKNSGAKR